MNDRSRCSAAICCIAFLSGAAALVFETLLFRQVGLAVGNSVWAVSIVLSSFMAGLALGNWLMVLRGDRVREPLLVYAVLEMVIGGSGTLLVGFLPVMQPLLVPLFRSALDTPGTLALVRLTIAFSALLVPAAAMGMTLPALVGALTRRQVPFGRTLGAVYGWNTLGAVIGTLIAERVLVELVGVTYAGSIAALGNFLAAVGALVLYGLGKHRDDAVATSDQTIDPIPPGGGTGDPAPGDPAPGDPAPGESSWLARTSLLAAAFLFGANLLALEVVWFRFFLMFVPGFAWNLAVMLAIVLSGIALGGLLGSAWFRRRPDADRNLVALSLLAAGLVAGLYRGMLLPGLLDENQIWRSQLYLMFPVSLVSGLLYTLVGQGIQRQVGSSMNAAGRVTMSNTVGAAIGSLAGGFLLIPRLGMEGSFWLLSVSYAVAALLGCRTCRWSSRWWVGGLGVVWLANLVLFPFGAMQDRIFAVPSEVQRMGIRRVLYREGLTETIQYFQRDLAGEPWFYVLKTNSHPMSSTTMESQRYMKLYVYWPIAVRPDAKDALLISYGVGSTAKALTDTKSLRSIDVVDISRDILEAGKVVYPEASEFPLNDPRVKVHVEDGRFFLLTTPKKFDLVTAEPPPPRHSGIANLYSREYFALVRDRLNEGGIVTYWLPVYQLQPDEAKAIQRAFADVFPQCSLWTGNFLEWMMVGVKGELNPPSSEEFLRQWKDPVVSRELRRLGFHSAEQFGSLFIADGPRLAAWLNDTPPLVDNYPQRLRSRPVEISPAAMAEYQQFMNDPGASGNFVQSPAIAQVWPEEIRSATLEHFRARNVINSLLSMQQPDVFALHETLTDPLLAGYSLWAMKGNAFGQEIVSRLSPERLQATPMSTEVWWNMTADAVARGQYAAAARYLDVPFQQAQQPPPAWCLQLQIYLFLQAGEPQHAAALHDLGMRYTTSGEERRNWLAFFHWAQTATSVARDSR